MRLFNQLIFDQTVRANANNDEVVCSPEFNALLGKAYDLVFEIEVEEATGAAPTLTVKYKQTNSGKVFTALAADLVTTVSLATLPYRTIKPVSGPLAALGQISVKLAAATDTARVRVWVSGWSK